MGVDSYMQCAFYLPRGRRLYSSPVLRPPPHRAKREVIAQSLLITSGYYSSSKWKFHRSAVNKSCLIYLHMEYTYILEYTHTYLIIYTSLYIFIFMHKYTRIYSHIYMFLCVRILQLLYLNSFLKSYVKEFIFAILLFNLSIMDYYLTFLQ